MSLLMDTLVDALSWRFNSAALEIRVQLSSSIMLFSGYKARGALPDQVVSLCLVL